MVDGMVLAGGPGRRIGRPKASLPLLGRTLVERAVDALGARCRRVVVVSRPEVALPPLMVEVVMDRPGPDAPLAAVASGLAALDAAEVLVLGCDLPLAGPVLDRLLAAPAGGAAAAADEGGPQPLCARYPREAALAACEALIGAGDLRARALLTALGARPVAATRDELINVNTAADLRRAEELLRREAGA